MKNKRRKKDDNYNKGKYKQDYTRNLKENYKLGIKYYEKVDKE